jgi:hypothetical protein
MPFAVRYGCLGHVRCTSVAPHVALTERPPRPDIDAPDQLPGGPASPQVTRPLTTLNVTLALANVIQAPRHWDRRGCVVARKEGHRRQRWTRCVSPCTLFGMPSKDFVEQLWAAEYLDLTKRMAGGDPGSANFETARAVLQARVALDNERMARATRRLVWATFALVLATVLLAVVTVVVAD